jgi:hypothetical protein
MPVSTASSAQMTAAPKRVDHGVERAVVVEMVGLYVRDDREVGLEEQERAVRLVGLDNVQVPRAAAGVATDVVEFAPYQEGRIEPDRGKCRRGHRRRGRLAVGARDGDRAAVSGERGEHLRALPYRKSTPPRLDELRVRLGDRRGHHDDLGVPEVLRSMPYVHRDPVIGERGCVSRHPQVGPGDGEALVVQDLRDAAHPRATDPDEVSADTAAHEVSSLSATSWSSSG